MKDVKDLKKKKMNVEQDFRLKKTSEGLGNKLKMQIARQRLKLRKQHVWQVYRRKKRID